jgi:hypothetical protein
VGQGQIPFTTMTSCPNRIPIAFEEWDNAIEAPPWIILNIDRRDAAGLRVAASEVLRPGWLNRLDHSKLVRVDGSDGS